MHFTSILALALPAAIMAQSAITTSTIITTTAATTTSSAATATPTALDYEAICEAENPSYADKCPQCLSQCEGETTEAIAAQCYYSVFFEVNYLESVCEAHGGNNCEGASVDKVCGSS